MVKWKLRGKNKIGEISLLSGLATVNKNLIRAERYSPLTKVQWLLARGDEVIFLTNII